MNEEKKCNKGAEANHLQYFFVFTEPQRSENKNDGDILFNIRHLDHNPAIHRDANFPLGLDAIANKLQVQYRNGLIALFSERDDFCHVGGTGRAAFEHKHLQKRVNKAPTQRDGNGATMLLARRSWAIKTFSEPLTTK
jgi:hypothetical protein